MLFLTFSFNSWKIYPCKVVLHPESSLQEEEYTFEVMEDFDDLIPGDFECA